MVPSVVVSATGKQWTIGTAIGAGMHGCVYTTSSPESGYWFWDPVVVLKLVSTAQGHVVENEQRVGRIANDRHLCRLLDSFAHPPDYHCFLYEQLEVTLEEVLQNKMHFDESHALFHIMLGVQALHRAGFLHRDLKPANVMFRDGVGKLIDYGFAAPIGEGGPLAFAPPYRAPEIVLGRTCTEAGDAWAMGAIAAEMATRKPLFAFATHQTNEQVQESMEQAFNVRRGCLAVDNASVAAIAPLDLGTAAGPQRTQCAASANALLVVSPRAQCEALYELNSMAICSDFAYIQFLLGPSTRVE